VVGLDIWGQVQWGLACLRLLGWGWRGWVNVGTGKLGKWFAGNGGGLSRQSGVSGVGNEGRKIFHALHAGILI
jgi:hypothetical protein